MNSGHTSSPTPLNHSNPLEVLANEPHVSRGAYAARLDALRNQTDKQDPPHHEVVYEHAEKKAADEDVGNEYGDENFINEGNDDNDNEGSGLVPNQVMLISLVRPFFCRHPRSLDKVVHSKGVVEVAESSSAGRFWNLPFAPQWGFTESFMQGNETLLQRMQKKMAKIRAEYDNNVSAYDQLLKDYNGIVNTKKEVSKRVEELEVEKKELEEINGKQTDRIKQIKDELEKSVTKAHQLRKEREDFAVKCGHGEMVRQKIVREYIPTFVRRLRQSNEYKQSLGDVFSLALAKGWIDGISVNRIDPTVPVLHFHL
ncbi:hypothetical protein Tco_1541737 [Tanacetum coccineum]